MSKRMIDTSPIYEAPRGTEFKSFIHKLLVKSNLDDKYSKVLIDDDSMRTYNRAFTSSTAEPSELENYEVFEQLGDMTANKFLVWYFHRRFREIPVKIVARLRINYGSKQTFAKIADSLGFWSFIRAREDERSRDKKSLLEDTFEAFLGATETLCDDKFRRGVGYHICYSILESIFDEIPVSLKYEDLYDPKTRLKELVDCNVGMEIKYDDSIGYYDSEETQAYKASTVLCLLPGSRRWIRVGEGTASLKTDAQQMAARAALAKLKLMGISKSVPPEYETFM